MARRRKAPPVERRRPSRMQRTACLVSVLVTVAFGCTETASRGDALDTAPSGAADASVATDGAPSGTPSGGLDAGRDAAAPLDASHDAGTRDAATDAGRDAAPPPTSLDLHQVTLFDNPADLADWPVTTLITDVEFQYNGKDGVHVEFSKRDGAGSWPDVTPPGWQGPLEYTLGIVEQIDGQWYGSAAIQFWRNLDAFGGNVASDIVSNGPCAAFGEASSCQIGKNWYYDARWGRLAGRQPATGETFGIFVAAGNLRGVTDGSQSPARERSNVVLVRMPDFGGAKYTF